MTATRTEVALILSSGHPAAGMRSGKEWRTTSVQRDIAKFHHLVCGAFSCALPTDYPRGAQAFSAHILFLKAGALEVLQWGNRRRLGPGDIFVGCGWMPMTLATEEGLDALFVELPGWWALNNFVDQFQILPDLSVGAEFFAADIITGLAERLYRSEQGEAAARQGLDMLADLMRTALAACVDTKKPTPRAVGRMGDILAFVAHNLAKPGLSAQEAAAALKCSVRTIHKTCSDHGVSFGGFVTELRLATAQDRLLRTDERVSQIAYSVGFTSLPHFSRQFRARFGVPASEYRSERREQGRR